MLNKFMDVTKNKVNADSYKVRLKRLRKLVRTQGVLVKRLDKGLSVFDIPKTPWRPMGAVPVKNIFGRCTNIYVVFQDNDRTIRYYDIPQFTKRDIKQNKHFDNIITERKVENIEVIRGSHSFIIHRDGRIVYDILDRDGEIMSTIQDALANGESEKFDELFKMLVEEIQNNFECLGETKFSDEENAELKRKFMLAENQNVELKMHMEKS